MKITLFLECLTVFFLAAGCAGASRNDRRVSPEQGDVVFEMNNQNLHSNSARVYITDRNCNLAGARWYEVSSGGKRSINLNSTDFNPGGFAIYVRLTEGVSGLNVIERKCTAGQPSPLPGSLVSLVIPSDLRYLDDPGIFPLR